MNTNSTNTHNTRGASRKALRLTSAEFDEQLELVAASGLLVPEDERGLAWQRFVDALLEQRDRVGVPA